MTLNPLPTDPAALAGLYHHMGADALLAHIEAATAALAGLGVEITPDARRGLDEITECVVEHHGRTNPAALARHLEGLRADIAADAASGLGPERPARTGQPKAPHNEVRR